MPSQSELNGVIAEILEVPQDSFDDASDLEELGWDSLSSMTFISIADERYRSRIDVDRLATAETPADLHELFG
ncbi:acyl carrier protein [uncultured Amnibacterium sp.]|uniref:acyl carrier protein n=1 Tax=uncultured Amnibacterium sp. TaxID=1631851 RepID=UPI0035C9AD9B